MKFKVGDKVKFLDEKGGGIVSRIQGNQVVYVAVEDGFEIPVTPSDLVKIEAVSGAERMFDDKYDITIPESSLQEAEEEPDRQSKLSKKFSRQPLPQGIYLAYAPCNQKWLITGDLYIYLINHTPYTILFNLFLETDKDKYAGADYGSIEPGSKLLVSTIEREQINEYSAGILQAMFHSDEPETVLPPLNSEFKARAMKFLNENSYLENPFLDEKAIILCIRELSGIAETTGKLKKPSIIKEKSIIEKHMLPSGTAEVDLHIDKLVDEHKSLSPHEALSIQTDYFRRCLEASIDSEVRKVVFIHGVGSGMLKAEIIAMLKQTEGVEWRDARMDIYGTGATEVIIRQKR